MTNHIDDNLIRVNCEISDPRTDAYGYSITPFNKFETSGTYRKDTLCLDTFAGLQGSPNLQDYICCWYKCHADIPKAEQGVKFVCDDDGIRDVISFADKYGLREIWLYWERRRKLSFTLSRKSYSKSRDSSRESSSDLLSEQQNTKRIKVFEVDDTNSSGSECSVSSASRNASPVKTSSMFTDESSSLVTDESSSLVTDESSSLVTDESSDTISFDDEYSTSASLSASTDESLGSVSLSTDFDISASISTDNSTKDNSEKKYDIASYLTVSQLAVDLLEIPQWIDSNRLVYLSIKEFIQTHNLGKKYDVLRTVSNFSSYVDNPLMRFNIVLDMIRLNKYGDFPHMLAHTILTNDFPWLRKFIKNFEVEGEMQLMKTLFQCYGKTGHDLIHYFSSELEISKTCVLSSALYMRAYWWIEQQKHFEASDLVVAFVGQVSQYEYRLILSKCPNYSIATALEKILHVEHEAAFNNVYIATDSTLFIGLHEINRKLRKQQVEDHKPYTHSRIHSLMIDCILKKVENSFAPFWPPTFYGLLKNMSLFTFKNLSQETQRKVWNVMKTLKVKK